MPLNCDCLGCGNIAKYQRTRQPYKGPCVPTKSYNRNSNRENNGNEFNVNCIPRPNANEDYERNVKTSDIYRTKNIPERFDRSCELHSIFNGNSAVFHFKLTLRFFSSLLGFIHAGSLNGYGNQWKKFDPVFHTSNSEYGWQPPNAHTVPHRYLIHIFDKF